MKLLEDRIRSCGSVSGGGVLKVGSFLNQLIDVPFICELGREFRRRFDGCGVNKILTIEASGIGIACLTAQYFDCPVVFAKKSKSINQPDGVYTSSVYSFTHQTTNQISVGKEFLTASDTVLVIDDFLADGNALRGLFDLTAQAGAALAGAGIVIEKAFQGGGDRLRAEGFRIESLARVAAMEPGKEILFCD